MSKTEAKAILDAELDSFRTMPYAELVALIGRVHTPERVGVSGETYQVEIEAFWENSAKKRVRVVGSCDESPHKPVFWNVPLLRWVPIYVSSATWTFSRDEGGTDEQSPLHSSEPTPVRGVRLGHVGLTFSLLGFVGVCLASIPSPLACLAFLSVPGLLISVIGLFWPPRRLSAGGAILGLLGSLYVPTILQSFLSLFVRGG